MNIFKDYETKKANWGSPWEWIFMINWLITGVITIGLLESTKLIILWIVMIAFYVLLSDFGMRGWNDEGTNWWDLKGDEINEM